MSSCYFYMYFVPVYMLILGFTIVVDYFAGILIEKNEGRRRKAYLIASLIANIGVLAVFKYYNFFNSVITDVLADFTYQNPIPYLSILLPIGLSFHTFQAMSYTIEVFRKKQKSERHFGIYALYVMFYPQLVAGPIERPQNMLHQFREKHDFDYNRVVDGLKLMLWGLFKKLVIADRLGIYVDAVYNNMGEHNGSSIFLATLFFSIQIYCDFSGYTDIAIGAARVMGFKLMLNFKRPVFAKSTGEHWKRWHISLSTWFKDYLYFPLGGSRVSQTRLYYNLMVVFLISGFWHGANWTYVIWGGINGFYLVMGMVTKKHRERFNKFITIDRYPRLLLVTQIIITFVLISLSRVFFRSASIQDALLAFKKIFTMPGPIFMKNPSMMLFSIMAIAILLIVESKQEFYGEKFSLLNNRKWYIRNLSYAVLIILILLLGVFDGGQFIYFQF